ncbi:MAG: choice-of-anchor D domain-containing protein [Terracidiphilus sp.]
MDGNGNVFVADLSHSSVKEIPPGCTSSACVTTLGGGFDTPEGVAVDGSGNVFVADPSDNAMKEIERSAGNFGSVAVGVSSAQTFPVYFIFDTAGTLGSTAVLTQGAPNLDFTDAGDDTCVAGDSYDAGDSCDVNVAFTPKFAGTRYGAAVLKDSSGNVFATGYVYGAGSGPQVNFLPGTLSTLGGGFNGPEGVAVDGSGNVFVADYVHSAVKELDFADPPSLSFASTPVGATSSDSPQTVTLENVGNAALTFPIPSTGSNPSIAANFTLNSSGTTACPLLSAGSSTAATLAAAASCTLPISFSPTTVGAFTGFLTLTDNALNAPAPDYATQAIALSGTGTQVTPTITWATPAPITYGTALGGILDATAWNGPASVAGSFAYTATPTGGTAVAVTAATILATGSYTLTANFTPTNTTDYTAATATVQLTVNQVVALITPTPGTVLAGSSVTFTWTPGTGVTNYQLLLGTTGVGSQNLYESGSTTATTVTVNNVPTYGLTVYARLWWEIDAAWKSADYTYTEAGSPVLPVLTTPTPGSVLPGSSVAFTWTAGGGPSAYQLYLGTTGVGSHNLYESGATTATTVTVSNLPTAGVTVYARLWWLIGTTWSSADYTYTEAGTPVLPVLTTPAPGSTLAGSSVAFAWTAGAGPAAYQLYVGTTGVGSHNLYESGATTATTETVSDLPTTGVTVYVRLWWEIDAVWQSADYTYTAQ